MEIAGKAFLKLAPEMVAEGTALNALFASFANSRTLTIH